LAGLVSWRLPKADGGIITQRCDGFQGHVAAALDGPFIVLFEQDRADDECRSLATPEADDRSRP
jgi:hypothetical protein